MSEKEKHEHLQWRDSVSILSQMNPHFVTIDSRL